MSRRISEARIARVRERLASRARTVTAYADSPLVEYRDWWYELRARVEARGIRAYARPNEHPGQAPYGMYHRCPVTFLSTMPVAVLRRLLDDDEDISETHPLHARAWTNADSLTREDWHALDCLPRRWGVPDAWRPRGGPRPLPPLVFITTPADFAWPTRDLTRCDASG